MLVVRSYQPADRPQLRRLLAFLPEFYPGATDWLEWRLDKLENHEFGSCVVVSCGQELVAVLIETPTGPRELRLHTFYVDERFRGQGIGTGLLACAQRHWPRRTYITVSDERDEELRPILEQQGFIPEACQPNAYRPGHDEFVFARYDG